VLLATGVIHLVIGVALIGGLLTLATICALKGKWVFFALGWFCGIFWIIGAARLGKPGSRWARRYYVGTGLMAHAERRYSRSDSN